MRDDEHRRDVRVKVHSEISVSWNGRRARGLTDNVSERGVMVTLAEDVALRRGQRVTLRFTLPGVVDPCLVEARVRWTSAVLPGVVGMEFEHALDHDARAMLSVLHRDQSP